MQVKDMTKGNELKLIFLFSLPFNAWKYISAAIYSL